MTTGSPDINDITLDSVAIRLSVICEACNHAVPVNGITMTVKCGSCQEVIQLGGKFHWRELLNYHNPSIDVFHATMSHRQGCGDYGAWAPAKLNTIHEWPKCEKCGQRFDAGSLATDGDRGARLACQKCGDIEPLREIADFFKKTFPCAIHQVGGVSKDVRVDRRAKNAHGSAPVVMSCMSCGGALPVDGISRLVECEFCKVKNYLPDDLWLSLHPAQKREYWHIIFDPKLLP